jgi:uncharacterized protein (TIGR03437 family)
VLKRSRTTIAMLCLLACGIAAQAATTTTFWAGTSAGLLKTIDGGATWQSVTVTTSNSLLQGTLQIPAVAVDPQQPSTIYFLGYANAVGFFRSIDAGKTWTGITLIGATAASGSVFIAVDPVFTNIIYLGTGGVLRKSIDFGTTWSLVTLPNLPAQNGGTPVRVGGLSVDPSVAGTLYVSYEVFMYKSTDFGNTWTVLGRIAGTLSSFSVGTVIVDPRNSNTLYVADQFPFVNGTCGTTLTNTSCGLFKSTDGGNSWTNAAPAGIYTEVAFDARNGNLYVGGQITGVGGGVIKSTDGGNTWNPVNNTVSRNQLVVDPGAAGTLLAFDPYGAESSVFRSSDAGATWTTLNLKSIAIGTSFVFPNVYCLAVAKPVGNVSAASFQGGAVTPESIVSALGFDLATGAVQATQQGVTSLGGTTVTVVDSTGTSRLAPLFYVSPTQVNYEIPAGTAAGVAIITVKSGDGVLSVASLGIAAVAPGIFILNATGLAAAYAFRISGANQTYENVYQVDPTNSVVSRPIDLGPSGDQVYLLLYGTGLRAAGNVSVTIGGIAAPVIFSGAQGQFAGEDQVNVGPIPRSLAGRGSVEVVLTADGHVANSVSVTIK